MFMQKNVSMSKSAELGTLLNEKYEKSYLTEMFKKIILKSKTQEGISC